MKEFAVARFAKDPILAHLFEAMLNASHKHMLRSQKYHLRFLMLLSAIHLLASVFVLPIVLFMFFPYLYRWSFSCFCNIVSLSQ